MKKLVDNKHLFHTLKNARPKLRNAIVENMKLSSVKVLAEIAKNTLSGVTNIIDTKYHKLLKKYKKKLRMLASRSISLSAKRKLIQTSGSLLIFLLESIFTGIIGEIIEKQSI